MSDKNKKPSVSFNTDHYAMLCANNPKEASKYISQFHNDEDLKMNKAYAEHMAAKETEKRKLKKLEEASAKKQEETVEGGDKEPTRDELKEILTKAGVDFKGNAKTADLKALVDSLGKEG